MRKKFIFVLSLLFGINNLVSSQPNKISPQGDKIPIYDVPDGEADIMGYLRYDMKYRTKRINIFQVRQS